MPNGYANQVARSPPKKMFKNLYRFRLIEFFTLNAAVALAIGLTQLVQWPKADLPWVIGVLIAAAILIWCLTRLGRTSPTPGLFLAAYAGALYGLSDLSLWMTILGRLAIFNATNSLFPASAPLHGWQERAATIAVIAALMTIPAILSSCTWVTIVTLVQIACKKFEPPKTLIGRSQAIINAAVALLVIAGLTYYAARPQIRYVSTIRIPYEYEKLEIADAPSICDWTISADQSELLALRSDNHLVRAALATGKVRSEILLERNFVGRTSRRKVSGVFQSYRSDWNADKIQEAELLHGYGAPDQIVLLCNPRSYTDRKFEVYDATTGELCPDDNFAALSHKSIFGFSPNRRFAAMRDSSQVATDPGSASTSNRTVQIWDLWKPACIKEVAGPPPDFSHGATVVDNTGQQAFFIPHKLIFAEGSFGSRFRTLLSPMRIYVFLNASQVGRWQLINNALVSESDSTDLLRDYALYRFQNVLHPVDARVVMYAEQMRENERTMDQAARLPVIEHLLRASHENQLTIFSPSDKTAATSWLRPGIFKNKTFTSAKFTESGRYLIIQDEDATADLFHVFAMP